MKLLACVLAAGLCACSVAPREERSDAPVAPPGWRTTLPGQGPVEPHWWAGFGDPVLTRLVERALQANLDVATAAARVREARAQEDLARSQLFPSLDFSYSGNRARTLSSFGQATTVTTQQPAFQAAYEVDLFGRIADQVAAARATTLATAAAHDAAALSVAAASASGYITLRALDARLVLLQRTVESRRDAMRVARERAETGYTSDLERRQAEAEYEATAQQLPQTQLAIERQEHALAVLTGSPPADIPRGRELAQIAMPRAPDALPSDLLRGRPDIVQAEDTLVAADATLASARAQFLPTILLSATLGELAVSSLPDPVAIWSVGSSVLAPLFNGGLTRAQVDTASARREQAAYAYQRTVLTAFREVEDNLSALARIREQRVHLEAEQAALADALFHVGRRYLAGYSSYLEQLDAQRGLLNAELAVIQARADELTALVALSQAVGGGWSPQPAIASGR